MIEYTFPYWPKRLRIFSSVFCPFSESRYKLFTYFFLLSFLIFFWLCVFNWSVEILYICWIFCQIYKHCKYLRCACCLSILSIMYFDEENFLILVLSILLVCNLWLVFFGILFEEYLLLTGVWRFSPLFLFLEPLLFYLSYLYLHLPGMYVVR